MVAGFKVIVTGPTSRAGEATVIVAVDPPGAKCHGEAAETTMPLATGEFDRETVYPTSRGPTGLLRATVTEPFEIRTPRLHATVNGDEGGLTG